MDTAVTRRTETGLIHREDQRVTPTEAVGMWTTGPAAGVGAAGRAGALRPGWMPTWVVLSSDPLAAGAMLRDVRVERTIVAGRTLYGA